MQRHGLEWFQVHPRTLDALQNDTWFLIPCSSWLAWVPDWSASRREPARRRDAKRVAMRGRDPLTTSWDDGEPADLRLADLLEKHGIAVMFHEPSRNVRKAGRSCGPSEIRCLGQHFEIGGHTRDHIMLTQLKPDLAAQQIDNNKKWLEDSLGGEVSGFADVRGHHKHYNAYCNERLVSGTRERPRLFLIPKDRTRISDDKHAVLSSQR